MQPQTPTPSSSPLLQASHRSSAPQASQSNSGVALVIVLSFIVLVTGLIVAFFSRSILDRQISNSSASKTRVEIFAQGAMDAIIGDLRQEIADDKNSLKSVATVNGIRYSLYLPRTGFNMVPSLVGSTGSNGLENLVKVSSDTLPFYASGPMRACSVATTGTSLNGRYMTAARWNKPLLMPATDGTNYTPKLTSGTFTPPNWVLVARGGSNPCSWSNALKTSATNSQSVVGRYAYAIYNEGGLLDANIAGYPIGSGSSAVPSEARYKPFASYADLRQIDEQLIDQRLNDQLIAWRNRGSAKPSGISMADPNFTLASGSSYSQALRENKSGFLMTGNALSADFQSDQRFLGRQQLVDFLLNCLKLPATSPAFQCLSTFSRSLNQPSLAPEFIDAFSLPAAQPGARYRVADSGGAFGTKGNDAFRNEEKWNPKFLLVRVNKTISGGRNDGTDLVEGEPLVKKRFALNQLAWVTYKGPSEGLSSDPLMDEYRKAGLSAEFLRLGTAERVYKCFGLKWTGNGTTGYWTYDHGVSSGGNVLVGTLADAQAANREPDFFELLKASIFAGSVAKATASNDGQASIYVKNKELYLDQSVDFQILQIGANILDQFDADGYPMHVQVQDTNLPGGWYHLYGKENLPYLNALHSCPAHIITSNTNGLVTVMEFPSIWNPVDASSAAPKGALAPKNLRITNHLGDPWGGLTPSNYQMRLNGYYTPAAPRNHYSLTPWPSRDSTAITFENAPSLYREPTLLAQPGVPEGSNLAMASTFSITTTIYGLPFTLVASNSTPLTETESVTVTDGAPVTFSGSTMMMVGWPYGAVPLRDGTCALAGLSRWAQPGRTVRLEWNDGGTTWQPYQELFWENHTPTYEYGGINSGCVPIIKKWNDCNHTMQTGFDVRSSRFHPVRGQAPAPPMGMIVAPYQLASTRPSNILRGLGGVTNYTTNTFYSNYDALDSAAGWGTSVNFVLPGACIQNSPIAQFYNSNNGSQPVTQCYSDPDGVVRRAMGAYTPVSTTPGVYTMVGASGTNGLATVTPVMPHSRPVMLNRPFRNVGELGCVFRDTPWKNLDFFTPESGDCGLLDVFCIVPDETPNGLVAGKVNLNTRQSPVLRAILSEALRDEYGLGSAPVLLSGSAIADALVRRTGTGGPLTNLSELVGKYTGTKNEYQQPFDGFSADPVFAPTDNSDVNNIVQRFRETSIRALAQVGEVRTWNLMVDLVTQTGRFPSTAVGLENFLVEGEKRYWMHVSIDRYTGEILDKQIEEVIE